MIRQDFIMRMIKRFIDAMILILKQKRGRQYLDARTVIGQTWEDIFGISQETVDSLSERTVLAMISRGQDIQVDYYLMAAWLYKAAGEVSDAEQQREESYRNYLKALNVYLETATHRRVSPETFRIADNRESQDDPDIADPKTEIEDLTEKLAHYVLPLPTQQMLFDYYEKFGRYAKAEDVLFHMIEDHPQDQNTIEMGMIFFQRLHKKSDEELEAGDLPRSEIEEGLAYLKAKG